MFLYNKIKRKRRESIHEKHSVYSVLLVLCSCNSDVFIDEFLPSVTELSLDGNGDSATIYFSNSNWNWLFLYVPVTDFSVEAYDVDGNQYDHTIHW